MSDNALAARESHDVRERGRWTIGQRAKNFAIATLVYGVLASVRGARPRRLRALGRALGRVAYLVLRGPRRTTRANLARVFPELAPAARDALARRTFATLGAYLGDTVALLAPRATSSLLVYPPEACRALDDAHAEGRGVVFASAHLGPWELVAATLVAHGTPLTAVARESYDPRLTPIYDRLRAQRGVPAIYRGERGSAARILRVLRRGDVLGIPMDLRSRVPSIASELLGQAAHTPVGPARLALRTGAAVVVGSATRTGSNNELVLTTTRISTTDLSPGADGERALTQRINDELSARIRAFPDAWVWMHPRFDAPEAHAAGESGAQRRAPL